MNEEICMGGNYPETRGQYPDFDEVAKCSNDMANQKLLQQGYNRGKTEGARYTKANDKPSVQGKRSLQILCIVIHFSKVKVDKGQQSDFWDYTEEANRITSRFAKVFAFVLFQLRDLNLSSCSSKDEMIETMEQRMRELIDFYRPMYVFVHFICHGNNRKEGLSYSNGVLQSGDLKQVFDRISKDEKINVIVFNSCHSNLIAKNLSISKSEHERITIGYNGSLETKNARQFAEEFYIAIGHGYDMEKAFSTAIGKLPQNTHGTYELYASAQQKGATFTYFQRCDMSSLSLASSFNKNSVAVDPHVDGNSYLKCTNKMKQTSTNRRREVASSDNCHPQCTTEMERSSPNLVGTVTGHAENRRLVNKMDNGYSDLNRNNLAGGQSLVNPAELISKKINGKTWHADC